MNWELVWNIWLFIIYEAKKAFCLVNRNNFPQFWYVPIALLHQTDSRVIHHKLPIFAEPDITNFTIREMKINRFDLPKLKIIQLTLMWLWPHESRQFAFLSHALVSFESIFHSILYKEFEHLYFKAKFPLMAHEQRFGIERVEIILWNSNNLLCLEVSTETVWRKITFNLWP